MYARGTCCWSTEFCARFGKLCWACECDHHEQEDEERDVQVGLPLPRSVSLRTNQGLARDELVGSVLN